MLANLLTRQRTILDQEVREPTVTVIVLAVMGFIVLVLTCALGIVFVPAFGYLWVTFALVAVVLAGLLWSLRRKAAPIPATPTGRQRWFRRVLVWGRLTLAALLVCWPGLILWQVLGPGGPNPSAKEDPALIRLVTWNIHCGQEHGLPWKQFDWPLRKHALRTALEQAQPDILCVQEATPDQVAFLEESLPGHQRFGIGRDGPAGGEHCAVFVNRQRFQALGDGTFWLEEPIDQPRPGGPFDVKRICTWVRLRDRVGGRTFRVYNTHLYLTEAPRRTAAELILKQIAAGDPADAIVLTADFNATPSAPSRRRFIECGLTDSAERAGKPSGRPTLQMYGIAYRCIDGILVDARWRVRNHLILSVKPHNTYPSDHFALLADLAPAE
jgi:endonuclease/exonuclease/phosphatase family metal-dependent hydrolase